MKTLLLFLSLCASLPAYGQGRLSINACWPAGTTVSCVSPIATASGGTGLSSIGSANQILGVNSGATGLEYKTVAVGTSGSDFAVANSANTLTLNLPDAGASARGAVTTGAQAFAGAKTFNGGAVFTGTTTVASGASGTQTNFNWYEEGTWTPVLSTTSTNFSSVTYGAQLGFFRRIGNVVFFNGEVNWTATTGSPSGTLQITGLPYTSKNTSGMIYTPTVEWGGLTLTSTAWVVVGELDNNATSIQFYQTQSGSGVTGVLAASNAGSVSRTIVISGFYYI